MIQLAKFDSDLADEAEEMTVPQAAKVACVSSQTIRRWIKEGRIQARHIATGTWRIPRAELDKVLYPAAESV